MLSRLHEAHQGIARSQARARLTIYWPDIDGDIENYVKGCRHCQNHLPSNTKEPLLLKPVPARPFQQVAVDFASYGGRRFLIIVDCKTGWPDVIDMGRDTTAQKLTNVLRDQFCRTAVQDVLWSDGGPQFTSSKFANFLVNWGTSHITSSPHYPQSNGQAEAAVKSMKKLMSAAWQGKSVNWGKLSRSLLQYGNTPCRKDGLSPAQKLFGHPVQDSLPAHHRSFALEWQKSLEEADKDASDTRHMTEQAYNQHTRELPDIKLGNHVAIQNPRSKLWDIYGVVTALASQRRYIVKTTSGRVFVRNRRFLRKRIPVSIGAREERHTTQKSQAPTTTTERRCYQRRKQKPQRLSDDPAWLLCSLDFSHQELEGEV